MKTEIEIRKEIKSLQRSMNLRFQQKREAENESVRMRQIDDRLDKIGAQIRSLQWVLN